ncbi:MAG: hypothetical protein ACRCT1_11685 [Microcoleaceae cyanobacterium]
MRTLLIAQTFFLLPSSFFLLPSSFFLLPSSFFLLPSSIKILFGVREDLVLFPLLQIPNVLLNFLIGNRAEIRRKNDRVHLRHIY